MLINSYINNLFRRELFVTNAELSLKSTDANTEDVRREERVIQYVRII